MLAYWPELIGIAAACATLYAAHAKTIVPLRTAAVVGNFLAMLYGLSHGTYPTFLLNAALLPLNAVRLHAMRKLIRDTARIDYDRFKELYFQNPQFGFHLLHLIVARLQSSRELPRAAVPT
jgi:hypothetical protein